MLQKPKIKYRKDYQKPDYLVDSVELTFFLDKQKTKVVSRLKLQKNYQEKKIRPILLNGEDLKLLSLKLNDRTLSAEEYQILDDGSLLILNPPSEKLELQIENEINPESNTKLSGLYISGDIFCTQCEAEGFRRITYFPDRPDIMAKFSQSKQVIFRSDLSVVPNIYDLPKLGAGHDGRVFRFNNKALKLLKYDISLRKEKDLMTFAKATYFLDELNLKRIVKPIDILLY